MGHRKLALVTALLTNLAIFVSVGCHLGSPARDLPLARRPAGAPMTVAVANERVAGELIEVRSDALLLLRDSDRKLVAVSVARINGGMIESGGPRGGVFRGVPSSRQLDRWRPLSRYPQGVSTTLLKRLLDAHGQEEVERPES